MFVRIIESSNFLLRKKKAHEILFFVRSFLSVL